MKIKLQMVVDAIEEVSDAYTSFYDTQKKEVVHLPDEWIIGETDEELMESLENEPDRYLRLPTKYEIHEYSIMEEFVDYLPSGKIKAELNNAIRGKGAFRRFKQSVRYHGIEQLWYDYLAEAYREIAKRWCRDNDLEFE